MGMCGSHLFVPVFSSEGTYGSSPPLQSSKGYWSHCFSSAVDYWSRCSTPHFPHTPHLAFAPPPRTADYDPFIESQLAYMQLTLWSYVVQLSSRNPQYFEVKKPSKSTVSRVVPPTLRKYTEFPVKIFTHTATTLRSCTLQIWRARTSRSPLVIPRKALRRWEGYLVHEKTPPPQGPPEDHK